MKSATATLSFGSPIFWVCYYASFYATNIGSIGLGGLRGFPCCRPTLLGNGQPERRLHRNGQEAESTEQDRDRAQALPTRWIVQRALYSSLCKHAMRSARARLEVSVPSEARELRLERQGDIGFAAVRGRR